LRQKGGRHEKPMLSREPRASPGKKEIL